MTKRQRGGGRRIAELHDYKISKLLIAGDQKRQSGGISEVRGQKSEALAVNSGLL